MPDALKIIDALRRGLHVSNKEIASAVNQFGANMAVSNFTQEAEVAASLLPPGYKYTVNGNNVLAASANPMSLIKIEAGDDLAINVCAVALLAWLSIADRSARLN